MSSKAPSEGTKVTAGRNAPVTSEGPGFVSQDSLAAESQSFRQANEVAPQDQHKEDQSRQSVPKPHEGGVHQNASKSSGATSAGTAPTYVQSQYIKDRGGPHGKNLTEDESIGTEDREKNASFSEFGTKADPGRAAEQKFTLRDTANAGSTGGREKGVDGQQPYEVLGSNAEA
ncbi:uncharacterized protein F4807DRAFT_22960 [Annulohypoxylon truncatum]|uniref:uncharacterized protein n=1 Tax=Annulohypoxylon truncatum TaxID=327061 RepID=UPI002007DB84|nr:uncharacterized protein F4807DRAFT_22960 [Annulohypoxylon truncatum]KAI1215145.1 hypothetical protein F4807DRAFT_22960 [Annulohypoxylon truncatum]